MNNWKKYAAAAVIATAIGSGYIQSSHRDVPPDFRDAAAEEASGKFELESVGASDIKPRKKIRAPVAAKTEKAKKPRSKSAVKVDAADMKKLISLARRVYENQSDGLHKGVVFTKHRFEIEGSDVVGGGFQLDAIKLTRGGGLVPIGHVRYNSGYWSTEITACVFTLYPDGTVDNEAAVRPMEQIVVDPWVVMKGLDKKMADMLREEVALWVEYENKNGDAPLPIN